MPCVLEDWEIDVEERRENKAKYGVDLTDQALLTRLLCEAVKLIPAKASKSPELEAWAKGHAARDRKKRARRK